MKRGVRKTPTFVFMCFLKGFFNIMKDYATVLSISFVIIVTSFIIIFITLFSFDFLLII